MQTVAMAEAKKPAGSVPQSEVEAIAARLKLGRLALGLKASQLCKLAKIAPNTYSQWENALGRPNLEGAKLLRRHLGYTLDWIYEGDPSGLPHALASKIAAIEAVDAQQTAVARRKGRAA